MLLCGVQRIVFMYCLLLVLLSDCVVSRGFGVLDIYFVVLDCLFTCIMGGIGRLQLLLEESGLYI